MTRVIIPAPALIESAVASGRYVYVTTYHDGATPIRAALLFRTTEDAAICARALSALTREQGADIIGPARGVKGRECEPRSGWHDRFICGNRLFIPREADECSAPHGAQEGSDK